MNYQEKMEEMISKIPKGQTPKLLLHACCAPCSSYCIEYLSNYFKITIYYYNPNIDTKEEYDKRVEELNRFVSEFKTKNPVKVVVENYDHNEYESVIKGHEEEEEGSNRCFICYELRMDKAALYAKKNKFKYFTTTLSISPYKNSAKLNEIGEKLGNKYNLKYLYADFKKKNGYKRSIDLSKEYKLYRQDYCGCVYSKIARDKREEAKAKRLLEEEEKKRKELEEEQKNKELQEQLNGFYNSKINEKELTKKNNKTDMYHFNGMGKIDTINPIFIKMFKLILLIIILVAGIYALNYKVIPKLKVYFNEAKEKKAEANFVSKLDTLFIAEQKADINELFIYGRTLNIKGNIDIEASDIKDVKLGLIGYNNDLDIDLIYNYNADKLNYYITNKVNDGYILDKLIIDTYYMYLKVFYENEVVYYKLNNNTSYEENTYYTVSDASGKQNKIKINVNSYKDTMEVSVHESSDKEVYDIVLDPGHGGSDPGACKNGRCETDFTLDYANILKGKLEEYGFKVKLTRDTDVFNSGYGHGGRVNVAHESNAKFLLSIHLNNNNQASYRSFELYTPYNVNYEFANKFVSDIKSITGMPDSNNPFVRVSNHIYTRTMSESDLNNIRNDGINKKYEPFNATLETNYYFMIRETGGYITGAYCDGRDDGTSINYYVNSNKGVESYIFEAGYIGNNDDIAILKDKNDEIFDSIAKNINDYLRK